MANVLPSVLPPRCDSFPLRRIVSHQCSSTGTAMASSLPHMAPPKSTNGGRNVSSLSFGNSRRSSAKSGCRLCRSRPPSAAVLLALVLPSLLMLLLGSIDSTAAMPNEWEEQRMCGRLLIQALKMVCNHQYAQPNRDNFYETTGVVLRVRRSPVPRSYVVKRQRQLLDDGTASAVAAPAGGGRAKAAEMRHEKLANSSHRDLTKLPPSPKRQLPAN
uniref:Uncharacterized protein n=1 Tax=Globodera pallida TaxID=36090 RepID=A0A183BWA7_GLOPA